MFRILGAVEVDFSSAVDGHDCDGSVTVDTGLFSMCFACIVYRTWHEENCAGIVNLQTALLVGVSIQRKEDRGAAEAQHQDRLRLQDHRRADRKW